MIAREHEARRTSSTALAKFSRWSIEIAKRTSGVAGFQRYRGAGSNLAWHGSTATAAWKKVRSVDRQNHHPDLHRINPTIGKAADRRSNVTVPNLSQRHLRQRADHGDD